MGIHEYAGKPVPRSLLVNVPRLVASYYTVQPDPAAAAQQAAKPVDVPNPMRPNSIAELTNTCRVSAAKAGRMPRNSACPVVSARRAPAVK